MDAELNEVCGFWKLGRKQPEIQLFCKLLERELGDYPRAFCSPKFPSVIQVSDRGTQCLRLHTSEGLSEFPSRICHERWIVPWDSEREVARAHLQRAEHCVKFLYVFLGS